MSNDCSSGCSCNSEKTETPQKLTFSLIDYFRALYSWLLAFRRTFTIEPGLYFTGKEYDITTPMLVTCNYHMTVFLLWRILKNRNVRILVIDTKGINVWCASGKGQFSAQTILEQLARYDKAILTDSENLTLILPKLSFSGVSIAQLKKHSITPKIGPIYVDDLPDYLDDLPLKNRTEDKYQFHLKDRLFTLVPSLVQVGKYSIITAIILFVVHYFLKTNIYWQVIPMAILITIFYIILFPILPTKKFTMKGIFMYGLQMILLSSYYFFIKGNFDVASFLFYTFFLGVFRFF